MSMGTLTAAMILLYLTEIWWAVVQ